MENVSHNSSASWSVNDQDPGANQQPFEEYKSFQNKNPSHEIEYQVFNHGNFQKQAHSASKRVKVLDHSSDEIPTGTRRLAKMQQPWMPSGQNFQPGQENMTPSVETDQNSQEFKSFGNTMEEAHYGNRNQHQNSYQVRDQHQSSTQEFQSALGFTGSMGGSSTIKLNQIQENQSNMYVQENQPIGIIYNQQTEPVDFSNQGFNENDYENENKASSPSLVSQDYNRDENLNGYEDEYEEGEQSESEAEHHKSNKNIHSIELHQSRRSEQKLLQSHQNQLTSPEQTMPLKIVQYSQDQSQPTSHGVTKGFDKEDSAFNQRLVRQENSDIQLVTQNSLPKNALVFIQQPTRNQEIIQDEASLMTFAQNQSEYNSLRDIGLKNSAENQRKRVISDINVEALNGPQSRTDNLIYPIDPRFHQQDQNSGYQELQNSSRQRSKVHSLQAPLNVNRTRQESSVIIQDFMSPDSNFEHQRGQSNLSKHSVIASLSSKILYLQTMFKNVDLIHYHQNRKIQLYHAFHKFRIQCLRRPFISKHDIGVQSKPKLVSKGSQQQILLHSSQSQTQIETRNQSLNTAQVITHELGLQARIEKTLKDCQSQTKLQPQLISSTSQTLLEPLKKQVAKINRETQMIENQRKSQGTGMSFLKKVDQETYMSRQVYNDHSQWPRDDVNESGSQTDIPFDCFEGYQSNPTKESLVRYIDKMQNPEQQIEMRRACASLFKFCDLLDEFKEANITRVMQLDQMEVDLMRRQQLLDQRNLENKGPNMSHQRSNSSQDITQKRLEKLLNSQNMSTQTECVYSDILSKEESLKILNEQLSLKQFKTLEQFNLRQAENSRAKCEIDIQFRHLEEISQDVEKQRQETKKLHNEVFETLNADFDPVDEEIFMRSKESRSFLESVKKGSVRDIEAKAKDLLKMQFELQKQKSSLKNLLKESEDLFHQRIKASKQQNYYLQSQIDQELISESLQTLTQKQKKFEHLIETIDQNLSKIKPIAYSNDTLQKMANQHMKYYGILSMFMTKDNKSYEKHKQNNEEYRTRYNFDTLGPDQRLDIEPKGNDIEDKVMITLGKIDELSEMAKNSVEGLIEQNISTLEIQNNTMITKEQDQVTQQNISKLVQNNSNSNMRENQNRDPNQDLPLILSRKEKSIERLKNMVIEQAQHIQSSTGGIKAINIKDHGISSKEIDLNSDGSQQLIDPELVTSYNNQLNKMMDFRNNHDEQQIHSGVINQSPDYQEEQYLNLIQGYGGLIDQPDDIQQELLDFQPKPRQTPAFQIEGHKAFKKSPIKSKTNDIPREDLFQETFNDPNKIRQVKRGANNMEWFNSQMRHRNNTSSGIPGAVANSFKSAEARNNSPPRAIGGLRSKSHNAQEKPRAILEQQKKLQMTQKSLQIQRDYVENLKGQLADQLAQINQQREDLKMIETDLNQQKLRMLIKFDKIKFLEDFYNQYQQREGLNEYIQLDIDYDPQQMYELSEQLFMNHSKKRQMLDKKQLWALDGMQGILRALLHKRKQTQLSKLKYGFYLLKVQTLRRNLQLNIKSRNFNLFKTNKFGVAEDQMEVMQRQESYEEKVYWNQVHKGFIPYRVVTEENHRFQLFRQKTVLNQMFLHHRRRARMLLYFAFQKYKTQIYKSVISDVIQKQDLAITRNEITPSEQDELLDQVFGANQTHLSKVSKGSSTQSMRGREGFLTSKIREQVTIKNRMSSLLLLNVMLRHKKDRLLKKNELFNRWKKFNTKEKLKAISKSDKAHAQEIQRLKIAHNQTLVQFNEQKQDLENKLSKMAILIQQRILNK